MRFSKYLPIILTCIFVPILTNCICSIHCELSVGSTNDWISFFGSFWGAVFTICGSLCLFHLSNKRDRMIREYESRKTYIKLLSDEMAERVSRLHMKYFYEIAVSLSNSKNQELNIEQQKQMLDYYFLVLADKNTFELKYNDVNISSFKVFKKCYFECIDNIIIIACYIIWKKDDSKLDTAIMFLSSLNEEKIRGLYKDANAWITEEKKLNEDFKLKNGI